MDFPNKSGTSWYTDFWDRLNELVADLSEEEMLHCERFANRCKYDDCPIARAECAAIEIINQRKI